MTSAADDATNRIDPGPVDPGDGPDHVDTPSASAALDADDDAGGWRHLPDLAVLATLTLSVVLVNLDQNGVAVLLPEIDRDIGLSAAGVTWIVAAFSLPIVALAVPLGSVGDRVGHRRLFVLGCLTFAGSSILVAIADSPSTLVASRFACGLGAALMIPAGQALVAEVYAGDDLGPALGVFNAIGGLALVAAPAITGLVASLGNWRVFFALNPILVVLAIPLGMRLFRTRAGRPDPSSPWSRRDRVAALLLGVALTSATVGVIVLGDGNLVVGLPALLVGIVLGVVRHRWLRASGDRPPDPSDRSARRPLVAIAMVSLIVGWGSVALPVYFGSVLGMDTLATGLAIMPMVLALFVGRLVSGGLVKDRGAPVVLAAGAWLLATGLLVGAVVAMLEQYWALVPLLVMVGLGLGAATTSATAAVLGAAAPSRRGEASGDVVTVRRIASLAGLVTIGAIATQVTTALDASPALPTAAGLAICGALAVVAAVVVVRRPA